jgi:serpin B
MQPEQVDLRMPRFTMECDLVLNEPLKQLGMPTAFSRDADFSNIDGLTDLYLSEVRQKVFVKVDETGTEAAAVTGARIAVKSAPLNVKVFYADRPFVFAIVKENTILFWGRFAKPDAEKPFIDPDLDGEGGAFH